MDERELARRIIEDSLYMTLSTADESGRPWVSPVWFAPASLTEFVWVSRPERRHSRNIAVRPEVAIVFFDSTVAPGLAKAVYVEARAEQVAEAGRAEALEVFSRHSEAQGLPRESEENVSGEGSLRLYRAVGSQHFVLDGNDNRVPVSFE